MDLKTAKKIIANKQDYSKLEIQKAQQFIDKNQNYGTVQQRRN